MGYTQGKSHFRATLRVATTATVRRVVPPRCRKIETVAARAATCSVRGCTAKSGRGAGEAEREGYGVNTPMPGGRNCFSEFVLHTNKWRRNLGR